MKRYFCTLFDSNYLTRGLAMYNSLKRTGISFHLYIFPFDQQCAEVLLALKLENVTLIDMGDFEDSELLRIKPTRTPVEYCWTCTPSVILYSIKKFGLPECTYLDADLYFFSTPEPIFDEMSGSDVLITEHRFSQQYASYIQNGIYNVQFMIFKNSSRGIEALTWWRERCIEWCYFRLEDGKLGDQKYLDDWTERFQGVHLLKNEGGALGPWNIQQYEILGGADLYVKNKTTGTKFKVIFFHFHNFKVSPYGFGKSIFYKLSQEIKISIYQPYLNELLKISREINLLFPSLIGKGLTESLYPEISMRSMFGQGIDGDNYLLYDEKLFIQGLERYPNARQNSKVGWIKRGSRKFAKILQNFMRA